MYKYGIVVDLWLDDLGWRARGLREHKMISSNLCHRFPYLVRVGLVWWSHLDAAPQGSREFRPNNCPSLAVAYDD